MSSIERRDFLRASSAAVLSATLNKELFAQAANGLPQHDTAWDSGALRHLLPAVSDTRMLIKVSFKYPLRGAPRLQVGSTTAIGTVCDTIGEHWQFYATGLEPGRPYTLVLADSNGNALCQPWQLATFPAPNASPDNFRLLIYTCAGGHEVHKFLPTAVRSRMLRRGLSFKPHAMVANGDHVYWDLLAPVRDQGSQLCLPIGRHRRLQPS